MDEAENVIPLALGFLAALTVALCAAQLGTSLLAAAARSLRRYGRRPAHAASVGGH
jgi:hypothetical protein